MGASLHPARGHKLQRWEAVKQRFEDLKGVRIDLMVVHLTNFHSTA